MRSGPSNVWYVASCQVLLKIRDASGCALQPGHVDPCVHFPSGVNLGFTPVRSSPSSSSIVKFTRRAGATEASEIKAHATRRSRTGMVVMAKSQVRLHRQNTEPTMKTLLPVNRRVDSATDVDLQRTQESYMEITDTNDARRFLLSEKEPPENKRTKCFSRVCAW